MKSSGNLSAPSPPRDPSPAQPAPSRKRFALTGPSQAFDPRTTAARADLADVRVADLVFAPHYAAHLPCRVTSPIALTTERDGDPVAQLQPGEPFEVLEITTGHAWGVAADGTVGYVPRGALEAA